MTRSYQTYPFHNDPYLACWCPNEAFRNKQYIFKWEDISGNNIELHAANESIYPLASTSEQYDSDEGVRLKYDPDTGRKYIDNPNQKFSMVPLNAFGHVGFTIFGVIGVTTTSDSRWLYNGIVGFGTQGNNPGKPGVVHDFVGWSSSASATFTDGAARIVQLRTQGGTYGGSTYSDAHVNGSFAVSITANYDRSHEPGTFIKAEKMYEFIMFTRYITDATYLSAINRYLGNKYRIAVP